MDPGPLVDVLEYEGVIEGLPYHVYGGLMTRRNVVYNRVFVGYSYRFIEDSTDLFKGVSTAHLQVFLGEAWRDCLGTHKNRLEHFREELFEDIRSRAKDWLVSAAQKSETLQLTSLALELEDYLAKMAKSTGVGAGAPETRPPPRKRQRAHATSPRESQGEAADDAASRKRKRGIAIVWDAALRQMGELRVSDDGEVVVALNPEDARVRVLREKRDCPGLVHIISAYVAQYAAVSEENARRVLRAGVLSGAQPSYRPHELYAYYYDRVDQPAVAHESE